MDKRYAIHPEHAKTFTTEQLRGQFLVQDLFVPNEVKLCYTLEDRVVIGGIYPVNEPVELKGYNEIKADYFLQRREIGIFNVGGSGSVRVDGEVYALNPKDCLYVGLGSRELIFESDASEQPAKFYIASAPAHKTYPTQKQEFKTVPAEELGSPETANSRVLRRYIHEDGIQSCQLVMGMTALNAGSVWNSMPTHTHDRRMEVYFYFELDENARMFHMMGEPTETRHIVMKNEEAVISPPWSIHCGAATSNYTFIWAMAGENYTYKDMDAVAMDELR
ncbi:5-dehydro-4-deoxy-D-glucuronate isomerase [Paenibacillus sp. P96]|uniref:4-deoxy-L-threo-5-hexosulose-uronate ketol-isomerase n=1 Tax=Paenibacillus zeirhizosphaerae TaxID=2987519 RepID=A0ABT9FNC7_9BACL|nr:5-dehydro-4-deoxy-D-glucuronate isomerase [Paenibacillus sp. P96]MDP4096224.1 5-dehydro-4-deoxy-D-glucuronate isomerase [Paenibacillus sp. P96]